jgi:hypothetical protein
MQTVLQPAKVKIFAFMSVLIHVAFVILFAEVILSFQPPPVRKLALTIITRGGAKGEIVQTEAAWPMPGRIEPDFSPEKALDSFGAEIAEWIDFGAPDPSLFEPKETLMPAVDLQKLAAKAYAPPPEELFSHPAPELKTMPPTDFALGPSVPELLGTD